MIGKIPIEWRNMVQTIRSLGVEAVLAGGCLRDIYCGKQVKDIDIFILQKGHFNPSSIKQLLDMGDWEDKQYNQFSPTYEIDYVIERKVKHKLPLQIIGVKGVKSTNDLISKFDYGLCQIAYDGTQIEYTQAFRTDFLNGTFTLTHTHSYDHSISRYKTWTEERYKGWPYVPSGIVMRHELINSYKLKNSA